MKVSKQEECHFVPEIKPNLNETISPIEIFFLMTSLEELLELIEPLCSSEWKKLHSYQRRTESISWNKHFYGTQ